MNWYVIGTIALLAVGFIGLVVKYGDARSDAGRAEAVGDFTKAAEKAAKVEAQKWADRPRNVSDAAKRLRLRAALKRKSKL